MFYLSFSLSSLVPSTICHSLLAALLPLGTELVDCLAQSEVKLLTVFKEFFHSCVMLAGKQSNRGHYDLVNATVEWLPKW